jgi:hypothetical protein
MKFILLSSEPIPEVSDTTGDAMKYYSWLNNFLISSSPTPSQIPSFSTSSSFFPVNAPSFV